MELWYIRLPVYIEQLYKVGLISVTVYVVLVGLYVAMYEATNDDVNVVLDTRAQSVCLIIRFVSSSSLSRTALSQIPLPQCPRLCCPLRVAGGHLWFAVLWITNWIVVFMIITTRLHVMQCKGIAKAFLSVRPSVCLSNACIVTKRKKLSVPTFL